MIGQGTSFKYDTLISYRHKPLDRKWAKWLLDSLETYKVPKALVDRGCARRIRRILRDEDELPSSSNLGQKYSSGT